MRCGTVQERLLLYLAGELEGRERDQILRHLERCTVCTAHADLLSETREQVDAVLNTEMTAPPTLEARVMSAVRALPPPRKPWHMLIPTAPRPLRMVVLSGAALILLGIGLFAGMRLNAFRSGETAARLDLTLLNAAHLHPPLLEAFSSPAPQIAEALTPRVGFPVQPVDLRPEGAGIIGAGKTVIQGMRVALIRYQWQGEGEKSDQISLFQMDARRLAPPALPQTEQRTESYVAGRMAGFNYVAWRSGRTNNVLIARVMPMHLLFQLACHACERQERSL